MNTPVPATRLRRWRPVQSGMGATSDLVRSLTRSLGTAARGSVRSVTLRSNLSPDVVLTGAQIWGPGTLIDPDTGEPVGPGEGGVPAPGRPFVLSEAFLRFAKPEIEIDTAAGRIRVAPYGEPTMNLFWPLLILGGAGITALTILAIKGWRRR